jgi:hypothetical protein
MNSNRVTTPFGAQSTAALDPDAAARLWRVSIDTLAS